MSLLLRLKYTFVSWLLLLLKCKCDSGNNGLLDSNGELTPGQQRTTQSLRGIVRDTIPQRFELSAANVHDYSSTHDQGDTPVFWKISYTGSNISVQPYLSDCLNLVIANEVGASLKEQEDEILQIVQLASERRYLNVDTTTLSGLEQPNAKHLAQSGLADVVISPLLNAVLEIFDSNHKARLFTFIRHPVERGASIFYHLQQAEKLKGEVDIFQKMTLEEYAASEYVHSNFMVRNLVNKPTEAILPADMYLAKMILRQKFVIGLSSEMDESLDRIQTFFGWKAVDHYRLGVFQRIKDCKAQYLSETHVSQHMVPHSPVLEGSKEWNLLLQKNWADMALYEFALDVYREQGTSLFQTIVNQQTNSVAYNNTKT